jgi:hypothetical protein
MDGGSQFGGDRQTIFMDRRLSEIWRELALHYFWAECFGGSQLGGDGQIVMTFRRLSQIWRELALHYFPVDCFGGIQFGGEGQTIFMDSRLSEIWRELAPHYFWADCFGFFQTLRIFFGARFRYKLMYYNLYHVSDLRKIVQFLCKIECIEFEYNKFVLVLVQIDLIHFEHSNCISSTSTKTNTYSLHSRSIHSILRKIRHVIQIVVHQFVRKTFSMFKMY